MPSSRTRYRLVRPLLPRGYRRYRVPGGFLYLDLRESPQMLARALYLYERGKHRAIADHLRTGMTFVDVGANKGDFTVFGAGLVGASGHVIAVEPESDNFNWLRRSITESAYTNVELVRAALGPQKGEGTLHLGRRSGTHSMLKGLRDHGETTQQVAVMRLDDLGEPIHAIKVDVEGFEALVLEGAERALESSHLQVLFMDLHPQLGANNHEVAGRLVSSGFRLCEPRRPYGSLVELESTREVLAVRQ